MHYHCEEDIPEDAYHDDAFRLTPFGLLGRIPPFFTWIVYSIQIFDFKILFKLILSGTLIPKSSWQGNIEL